MIVLTLFSLGVALAILGFVAAAILGSQWLKS